MTNFGEPLDQNPILPDPNEEDDRGINGMIKATGVAIRSLKKEIGELRDDEITPNTAPLIASQLLARRLEQSYLEQQEYGQEEHKEVIEIQEETGQFKETFTAAQHGNFVPLQEFAIKEATSLEGRTSSQTELAHQATKLRLVASRIPNEGDGSSIKTPNPAWMEAPIPLRMQLQMTRPGGEVR